jgi:hypothetical protein
MICPFTKTKCKTTCTEWDNCLIRPDGFGVLIWTVIALLLIAAWVAYMLMA